MNNQQKIVIVEDNQGDLELIKLALDLKKVQRELVHLADGQKALDYFRGLEYQQKPRLIILDLNLPRINGKEVLHFIKSQPWLKSIPVVVLSSSNLEQDIVDVYSLNANCFISKPIDLDDFISAIQSIDEFWFRTAAIPA